MSTETTDSTSDANVPDTANAANPGAGQTEGADAGAGTADAVTSSGADSASTSQANTDSNTAKSAMDRFTEQVRANRRATDTASAGAPQSAQTQAQALTIEQINEALGIKSPDDLKRIVNERSLLGRQANEVGQLRQQLSQMQQAQLAERQRQEQEAERAKISPFHAKHPQFAANQARIAKASTFEAMASALNPQDPNYAQLYNQMAARAGVTREDLALMKDAQAYRERIQVEQTSDPEGFVESRAARIIDARLAQFDQYLNNRMQANAFVQQHQDLINDPKAQQVMAAAMDERTSRAQLAIQLATLEREKAELLAQAKKETAEVETLKAQQELAGRQTLTRRRASTSTTTQTDPWAAYEAAKDDPKAQEKLLASLLRR